MATMESYLEDKFVEWCNKVEAKAVKGPTAQSKGFPDRFVALPNYGGTVYVEFKGTSSYGLEPLQKWWMMKIKKSSPDRYFLVACRSDLEDLIRMCEGFMAIGYDMLRMERILMAANHHRPAPEIAVQSWDGGNKIISDDNSFKLLEVVKNNKKLYQIVSVDRRTAAPNSIYTVEHVPDFSALVTDVRAEADVDETV